MKKTISRSIESVRRYVEQLEQTGMVLLVKVEPLEKRTEQLESRTKKFHEITVNCDQQIAHTQKRNEKNSIKNQKRSAEGPQKPSAVNAGNQGNKGILQTFKAIR